MKAQGPLGALVALLVFLAWPGALAMGVQPGQEGPRLYEELVEDLADKDPARRRRAVRDLAKHGGRDAWELVIERLSDPKGQVADEAQDQLAGLDEPRLLTKLFGGDGLGSRDALVRVRVAEALGRLRAGLEGEKLLRKVQRRDPELSETLLWSIERLARTGQLLGDSQKVSRGLVKLVKGGAEPRVPARAAFALAAVDPDAVRPLLPKLVRDRAPELRRTALLVGLEVDADGALDRGVQLGKDEIAGVRLAAVESIERAGTRRSLEVLVDRLKAERRLRIKVACVEALQRLSGRKHKLDPIHWERWVSSLPGDWSVSRRTEGTLDVGGTSSFAGLPILSDRVCFLIDFSGSLWYEREGRPARKGKVDELVRAALPRLPEGAEFNMIPYTGVPHPWREGLVKSTKRNVNKAITDFEANLSRGSGNVYDAVILALQDKRTDRIVILTDGAPTGGARWKLDLMMPLLLQARRFSGVTIDVIVVDARAGLRKRWFALAQATGGRAVGVEL